jgi:hypothetical protein
VNSFTTDECLLALQTAKDRLEDDDPSAALILIDRALELFLKESCVLEGCTENTVLHDHAAKPKPFLKWSFTDYVHFLDSKHLITKPAKSDLFLFHSWRNSTEHVGIEPSARQVLKVFTNVEAYFHDELKRRGANVSAERSLGQLERSIVDSSTDIANHKFSPGATDQESDRLDKDASTLSRLIDEKDFDSKIRSCSPETKNLVVELDKRIRSLDPGVIYYPSGNDIRYTHLDVRQISRLRRRPFIHISLRKNGVVVHIDKDVADPRGFTRKRNASSRFLKQFPVSSLGRLTSYHLDLMKQSLEIVRSLRG